jgi:uncharacterized protein
MALHEHFEWDDDKAATNLKKHGVSFDDAALVLTDEMATGFMLKNTMVNTAPEKIGT